MYYHVVDRRYKAVLKQLFSLLLIFSLYFNAFSSAHAAGLGGWTLGGGVSQGASVIYNGSKEVILNGAKKLATGVAKITPPPSSVAKALAGGAGAIALDLAIKELLGAVDWVLDPENNQIKYHTGDGLTPPDACSSNYLLKYNGESVTTLQAIKKIKDSTEIRFSNRFARDFVAVKSITCNAGSVTIDFDTKWCTSQCGVGAIYTYGGDGLGTERITLTIVGTAPSEQDDIKTLPLSTVAQQVISNAAAGNAAAQQAVKAAADTMVAEAETDSTKARPIINQLEASQSIPTDQTASGETVPKEQTGENTGADAKGSDISLQFPVFCNWAPTVCQAAKVVITKPQEWADSIKTAYDDAVDYFKNDEKPEEDNDSPEIQDLEPPVLNTNTFKSTAGCPAPIPVNITIGTKGTTEISYEPICQFAEKWSFVAPLIGFISGAMILIGVGRKGEDSEI
ncbi:MAG: hypothetical protein GXO52_00415 [Gammaproteobacteria bacterium]|nr:hypothetical protein [Gammaproteobacteria bacterium]